MPGQYIKNFVEVAVKSTRELDARRFSPLTIPLLSHFLDERRRTIFFLFFFCFLWFFFLFFFFQKNVFFIFWPRSLLDVSEDFTLFRSSSSGRVQQFSHLERGKLMRSLNYKRHVSSLFSRIPVFWFFFTAFSSAARTPWTSWY